jgi:hypothetical protein
MGGLACAGMLFVFAGLECPGGGGSDEPGDSGLTGKFVGAARCSQCHAGVHSTWTQTLHAHALETLEAVEQGENPDCLRCHTVGFGQPGGFVDRQTTNSLAGVGCESCHGPGGDHVSNVNNEALRPPISIRSDVCGTCHTGDFSPHFEDWASSAHAAVEPELVGRFASGSSLSSCGKCHSGDYFYRKTILGETVPENALAGLTSDQMAGITCAICHNPHARTGNAATPADGRDYQLRYPQIKYTTPTTDLAQVQNPDRFNICGQCHHARDRVWTDSNREPHPSDQVNVFFGEIPAPASDPTPIVPTRASVHLNTAEQCSTCHVPTRPAQPGISPAVSGHTFAVNYSGCVECHGTVEIAQAKLDALRIEIDFRTELVKEALDAWAAQFPTFCGSFDVAHCWEFTSEGGPDSAKQAKIPNGIKKARYIYYYILDGGGSGAHNPDFVREALILAEEYATTAGPPLP